jgi:hypothetical protein
VYAHRFHPSIWFEVSFQIQSNRQILLYIATPIKAAPQNLSIEIAAKFISKSKPTLIGSLEVISTIPVATILQSAEFTDAQMGFR